MDIIFDKWVMAPVLVGAALALAGAILTQSMFLYLANRSAKRAILTALTVELKQLREDIEVAIGGYRDSLRNSTHPAPRPFVLHAPIFTAVAGSLGNIRDNDLVEHIVETYASIQGLAVEARTYDRYPSELITLEEHNRIHMDATFCQVAILKLHNRLLDPKKPLSRSIDETESESLQLVKEWVPNIPHNLDAIFSKQWVSIDDPKSGQRT